MELLEKNFNIKIYDSTGSNFIATLKPSLLKAEPQFGVQLYGGYGECRLNLNLDFAEFGEGSIIDFMNVVRIYESDINNPNGRILYTGFISSFEPYINGSDQGVTLILLGMVSLLKLAYYKDSDFIVPHVAQDTGNIIKAIIDHFSSVYGSGLISYSPSSIDLVGNSVSYTFEEDLWFDAIQNAFGTIGAGNWFWYVDREGIFYLKQKPSTATHVFTIAKDVESLSVLKNSEKVVNAVTVKYNSNTYYSEDPASITTYGRRESIISDNRVINVSTAQARAEQEIALKKDLKKQASLVINSQYDLESINVGDTCKILNLTAGSPTLSDNMLIVGLEYRWDTMTIQLEEINNKFGVELEQFNNP